MNKSLLAPTSVKALMAQCADSAVAKSEARLAQRFDDRLADQCADVDGLAQDYSGIIGEGNCS